MNIGEACRRAEAHLRDGEVGEALTLLVENADVGAAHDLTPVLALLDPLVALMPELGAITGAIRVSGDRRVRDAARGVRELAVAFAAERDDAQRACVALAMAVERCALVGGDDDAAATHAAAAGRLGSREGWLMAASLRLRAGRADRRVGADVAAHLLAAAALGMPEEADRAAQAGCELLACHAQTRDPRHLEVAMALLRHAEAGGEGLPFKVPARGLPKGKMLRRMEAEAAAVVDGELRRPKAPRHWALDAPPPVTRPADLARADRVSRLVGAEFGLPPCVCETVAANFHGYADWPAMARACAAPGAPDLPDEEVDARTRGARREWQAHVAKVGIGLDDRVAVEVAAMLAPTGAAGQPRLAGLAGTLDDRLFDVSENEMRDGLEDLFARAGIDLDGRDPFSLIRMASPIRQDLWLGVMGMIGWTFTWTDLEVEGHGAKVAETVDAEGRTWPVHASPISHSPGDDDDEDAPSAMAEVEAGGPRGVLIFTKPVALERTDASRSNAIYAGMTYDGDRTPRERWSPFFLVRGEGIDGAVAQRGLHEAEDDGPFWARVGMPAAEARVVLTALMEPPRGQAATFEGKVIPTTKRGVADLMGMA